MASKPRFPSDRQVLNQQGYMTPEWQYFMRALSDQAGASGTYAVSASHNILIDTPATEIKFNADGTTYRDSTLHFPTLSGDVTNSGLTVSLANVGTPVVNKFVKLTTDSKGRVTATMDVTQLDLTNLIDGYYVKRSGDTMTGGLTVPSMIAQASVTSPLINVDNIQFAVTPATKLTTPGSLSWNDTDGCLDIVMKGGNVVLQVGQEQVQRMVNKSGVNVTDGQAVYVFGAQGNRVSFKLANANSEATSKATLGIVTEPIANNQEGFVTTEGLVRGLNTSAWAEGDVIYLNSVDGGLTNVQQVYPNHNVIIGYVVRSHAVVGSIYVKVNNGYELEELHNVVLTSLATNDLLKYDGAKWVNTASAAKADSLTTSRTISLTGDATGSVSFDGRANVSIAATLASIVTAGTYKSVTVDAKGRVTAGTNPTTLAGFGITDALNNVNPSYTGTLTGGVGVVNIGSGQFYKDASGNVGIGNTAPGARLQTGDGTAGITALYNRVFGSSTGADIYLGQSGGSVFGYTAGTIGLLYQNGNAPLGLVSVNAQPIFLGTGGNGAANVRVGIGSTGDVAIGKTTTAAQARLEIAGGTVSLTDAAYSYASSKFDSQGVARSTLTSPSLVINGAATDRPEIALYRGARTYPEFAIREHTIADTGAEIYAGGGIAVPTKIITLSAATVAYLATTASTSATTGAVTIAGGIGITGSIYSAASILVSGASSAMGYATGAGGTVTQLTSKSTGVTLNKASGQIVTSNAALASNAVVSFTVTNSLVAATDVIDIHRASGGTAVSYNIWVDSVAAGSFVVAIRNINAASLSEAITLSYIVTKSVTA